MQFQVVDIKTGQPVQGVTANTIDLQTNALLYEPTPLDVTAIFEMDVDVNPQYGVYLSAPGYKTLAVPFNLLFQSQDGILYMEKKLPVALTLVALAAIYAYMRKNKKVGALGVDDIRNIMLLTGGVIAFTLIKQLLEALGVWDSRDTKELDNAASNPLSFWNPNFYKTKPAYVDWTAPITYNDAVNLSKQLYDAMGWLNDNEEQAIAVFKSFRAQSSVSYLADVFTQIYGQDLLTFLRGGNWPQDRLSDADVQTINAYISRLPKY